MYAPNRYGIVSADFETYTKKRGMNQVLIAKYWLLISLLYGFRRFSTGLGLCFTVADMLFFFMSVANDFDRFLLAVASVSNSSFEHLTSNRPDG